MWRFATSEKFGEFQESNNILVRKISQIWEILVLWNLGLESQNPILAICRKPLRGVFRRGFLAKPRNFEKIPWLRKICSKGKIFCSTRKFFPKKNPFAGIFRDGRISIFGKIEIMSKIENFAQGWQKCQNPHGFQNFPYGENLPSINIVIQISEKFPGGWKIAEKWTKGAGKVRFLSKTKNSRPGAPV